MCTMPRHRLRRSFHPPLALLVGSVAPPISLSTAFCSPQQRGLGIVPPTQTLLQFLLLVISNSCHFQVRNPPSDLGRLQSHPPHGSSSVSQRTSPFCVGRLRSPPRSALVGSGPPPRSALVGAGLPRSLQWFGLGDPSAARPPPPRSRSASS